MTKPIIRRKTDPTVDQARRIPIIAASFDQDLVYDESTAHADDAAIPQHQIGLPRYTGAVPNG